MKRVIVQSVVAAGLATLLIPASARAQLNGSHTVGDYGVQSGTQPQPGLYTAVFYYHYTADSIRNAEGTEIELSPGSPKSLGINALAPLVWYVSKTKILGASYGAQIIFPWANASLEAPAFDLGRTAKTGFADMLVRPLDLGWHRKRMDASAGFQFYAPTGRYKAGAGDNLGKGMWAYEPFAGTTVYLDHKRSLSLATTAYWELHGKKEGSDARVGQLLTLEGGLGKSFAGGGLVIGAGYYSQWKLTRDDLGSFVLPGGGTVGVEANAKHRVFGLGPDVTLPVATKSKLYSLLNIRYFWETGARSKTQGKTLTVTATFPVPSVKLK